MTTIRVMTYNLHSCRGWDNRTVLDRTFAAIRALNPDILLAQELDKNLKRTHYTDQPGQLAQRLDMQVYFHPRLFHEDGQYGLAIFSKYPLKIVKTIDLQSHTKVQLKEATVAIQAHVSVESRTFNIFTTHFMHRIADRKSQAKFLTGPEWLGHKDCRTNTIFGGDLNSMTYSAIYREFAGVLRDPIKSHQNKTIRVSWPSFFPLFQLDHVFTSPDIQAVQAFIPWNKTLAWASDHLPVIIDVSV